MFYPSSLSPSPHDKGLSLSTLSAAMSSSTNEYNNSPSYGFSLNSLMSPYLPHVPSLPNINMSSFSSPSPPPSHYPHASSPLPTPTPSPSPSPSLSTITTSTTHTSTSSSTSPGYMHYLQSPHPHPPTSNTPSPPLHHHTHTPILTPLPSPYPYPASPRHPVRTLPPALPPPPAYAASAASKSSPLLPIPRRASPPHPTMRALETTFTSTAVPAINVTTRSVPVSTSDISIPVMAHISSILSNSATLSSNAPAISPSSAMSSSTSSSPLSISTLYSSSPDHLSVGARLTAMLATTPSHPAFGTLFPSPVVRDGTPSALISTTLPSSSSPNSPPPSLPPPFPRASTSAFTPTQAESWPASPFLSSFTSNKIPPLPPHPRQPSKRKRAPDSSSSSSSSDISSSDEDSAGSTDTSQDMPRSGSTSSDKIESSETSPTISSSSENPTEKKRKLDNSDTSPTTTSSSSDDDPKISPHLHHRKVTTNTSSSDEERQRQYEVRTEARHERRQHLERQRQSISCDNINVHTIPDAAEKSELLKGRVRNELAAQHKAAAEQKKHKYLDGMDIDSNNTTIPCTSTTSSSSTSATSSSDPSSSSSSDKPLSTFSSSSSRRTFTPNSGSGSGSGWESSDAPALHHHVIPPTATINTTTTTATHTSQPKKKLNKASRKEARRAKRERMKQKMRDMNAALQAATSQAQAAMEQVALLQQIILTQIQNGNMIFPTNNTSSVVVPPLSSTTTSNAKPITSSASLTPPGFPSLQHNPYAPSIHFSPTPTPSPSLATSLAPAIENTYAHASVGLTVPNSIVSLSSNSPSPPGGRDGMTTPSLSPSSASSGTLASPHPTSFLSPRLAFKLYHTSILIHDQLIHEMECIENETDRVLFWNSFLLFLIPSVLVQYLMQSRPTTLSWLRRFAECFLSIHHQLGSGRIPTCTSAADQLAMHCILVEAANLEEKQRMESLAAYSILPSCPTLDDGYISVRDHLLEADMITQLFALPSNTFITVGKQKAQINHPLHPDTLFERTNRIDTNHCKS